METEGSLLCKKGPTSNPRLCIAFRNKLLFYADELLDPAQPSLVGCPWLLIHNTRSYPPDLEAVSCIRNPRTFHGISRPISATI